MATRRLPSGWRGLLAVATALLASCGGGGGGSSDGGGGGGGTTITGKFFPLDSDGRWFYASVGTPSSSVRVVGPGTTGFGVAGTLVETTDVAGTVIGQSVYVVAADGIRQYAMSAFDPISQALDGLQVMRFPLRVGDSYEQLDTSFNSGQDFDGDGRSDQMALEVRMTVLGLETVTTAAGTFPGTLHQRQVILETVTPSSGLGKVTVTLTLDSWYAPDIGPLQTTLTVTATGINDSATELLMAYGVGGRRSETIAPTVLSVTPAMPVRPPFVDVSVTFSEAMDVHSVSAATFTVRDAGGLAVTPSSVTLDGNVARFAPALGFWPGGTYTATLSGVLDRVGNPLAAPYVWTFVADDVAPGVVASVPAMGAVDVALNSNIVVDFSEAIDPANTANIVLFDDAGAFRPSTAVVAGSRVIVTPNAALELGRTYQLRILAQTDVLGNEMPSYILSFRTVAGRFAPLAALIPGVLAYSTAIGDVTGDGIADVLLSTTSDTAAPYTSGLFLLAGRADGSRAAPVRLDIGASLANCLLDSIVIGDVDGDGRSDVVIGTGGCGLQVLHQSASGTLAPSQHFDTLLANAVRMVDLDGDGKREVVGSGDDFSLGVWSRDAGGLLVQTAGIPSSGGFGSPFFELADLNGDGRPDYVRTLVSLGVGQDIGVSLQLPDGTFGPRVNLTTGSVYGVSRIAVGDVDGDGRPDIVATSADQVAVFHQAVDGSFVRTVLPSFINSFGLALADMNNDGRLDVVVSHVQESRLGVYYQQPGGSLTAEEVYAAPLFNLGTLQPLALGDIDADGRRDILIDGQWLRQLPGSGAAALASANGKLKATRLQPALLARYGVSASRAATASTTPAAVPLSAAGRGRAER